MSSSIVALDYSRPVQSLWTQSMRVGMVHSAFRRAVNFTFDDALMTLTSSELPRVPHGVRVSVATWKKLADCWQVNTMVWLNGGLLHIPTCQRILALPAIAAWEPCPDIAAYQWQRYTVAQHIRLLVRSLIDRVAVESMAPLMGVLLLNEARTETPLTRTALPLLRQLARASWQLDEDAIKVATRGLAGLGPGLTPSGDDVLSGFVAVMALLSNVLSADGQSRTQLAPLIVEAARPRTTLLSGTLLAHAARGEVTEPVGIFLCALARPVNVFMHVLQAAKRVLLFGATSGADILFGLLLGLRVLEGIN